MSISLLKLKLGTQSDSISCKDSVMRYRAKYIYCKSGVLNAKALREDKSVTDSLIFFGAPSETVRTRILKKLILCLTSSKVTSDKRSV